MRNFRIYLHFIMLALALMIFPLRAVCQTDTLLIANDTTSTKDTSSQIHSLYAGADFGNNLIYMGSTISRNLPYYSTSLTYGFRNSLYFSASGSHLSKTVPFVAFYSLSASYIHVVNSWFDYSTSLAYYNTPESLHETLFSDFTFINLTTGFDWRLIYTKLSFSGLFSEDNNGYIQIRNSRYFQTGEFFKGKASLSFDPNINLLFGKLVKIETTTGTSNVGKAPPFVKFRKNPNNITESYSYVFGLMDTEFSIPVTLDFKNFSFEVETSYILPAYSNPDYPGPEGFSLNMSVYFRIL